MRIIDRLKHKLNKLSNRKECIVCKTKFYSFKAINGGQKSLSNFIKEVEIIGSDLDNFSCMYCWSNDRERHLFMYFDKLGIWEKMSGANVLHIAPEKHLLTKITNCEPQIYIKGDLFPSKPDFVKIDCTIIPYSDGYFDIVICNHVLEHIDDDIKAMSEIHRVLCVGGLAVLQTPFSSLLFNSFIDENINTPELKLKFYGQEDHVRLYGNDLFRKLERVGFKIKIIKNESYFSDTECFYHGVNKKEDLILVEKQ